MTPNSWTVFQIPKPVSEEHISLYTRIRLLGLSTNPEAFGSTHTRESTFTRETWTARINNPGRTTLAATVTNPETDTLGGGDWIGTLSILEPEMLASIPEEPAYPLKIAEAVHMGSADVYMFVGMWVHPDYRGQGVGRRLVEVALEIVRLYPSSFFDANEQLEKKGEAEKIALLEVHDQNHAAKALYTKAGFIKQEKLQADGALDEEDAEGWMAVTVN